MANTSGNAYALTIMSPIKNGFTPEGISYGDEIRNRLQALGVDGDSPMTRVPNTYIARFFVLDDVFFESTPACDPGGGILDILSTFWDRFRLAALPKEDHLKSNYLVFSSDFHGELDKYLEGMWKAIEADIRSIWQYCVAFDQVTSANEFIAYMKKCQLTANLYFMGSTDDSLDEQLKSLYLKQEFSKFAVDHQGMPAANLQKAFQEFTQHVKPSELTGPTWKPGQSTP